MRLVRDLQRHKELQLSGEEYKRPKGERGPLLNPWYNRRYVAVTCDRDFGGELLSPELPRILADTYAKLMPLYEFFLEVHRAVGAADDEVR